MDKKKKLVKVGKFLYEHKIETTLTVLLIVTGAVAIFEGKKARALQKENEQQKRENEQLENENKETREKNQKLEGENKALNKENKKLGRENANLNYHLGKQVEKNSKPKPRVYGMARGREINKKNDN